MCALNQRARLIERLEVANTLRLERCNGVVVAHAIALVEAREECFERVEGDEPPRSDDGDAAAQVLRLLHVMRREDDGRALRDCAAYDLPDGLTRRGVKSRRRFVEDEKGRATEERKTDEHTPPLSAGERSHSAV